MRVVVAGDAEFSPIAAAESVKILASVEAVRTFLSSPVL